MTDWPRLLGKMSPGELKATRNNAIRLGNANVLSLCDAEAAKRSPKRPRTKSVGASRTKLPVKGLHFVCPQETGVTQNPDGTIWTGTWVVDARHAKQGARSGAYVALHTAKSESSYLQGTIKDWRQSPREQEYADGRPAKTRFGIDFLLELTQSPYEWKGDGSGEKGYAYMEPSDDEAS